MGHPVRSRWRRSVHLVTSSTTPPFVTFLHLLCDDCQLASRSGTRELVSLLNLSSELDQVELVLLAHLVCAHQLKASWRLLSWNQVDRVLEVWSLGVKHHQLCLLVAAVVDVCHFV